MFEEYFEAKKRLYPQKVKGKIRSLKNALNFIFLSIFFFTPFLRFDRGESAPNQAIMIDLPNARAYFFNIEIWPQETYYLAGILILAAVALFFVTSLFGRIWCGYACFQTVWTDIFIALERLFQGDRNERILLDRKNNFKKYARKTLTHASWIIVSILTGYGFVNYFYDAFSLGENIFHGEIPANALGWSLGIAGMTYLMAGFAREHVCTFMCPYARFQSAMFDNNTLIISYDEKRGEPRAKAPKDGDFKNRGDCIDCKQCVVVCPTGIDIRNGLQMECIACGLCVDACNNIMDKMGLPKGLIRYDTISHLLDLKPEKKFKIFKARTFFYGAILLVVSALMLYSLIAKPTLEIAAIPDRNPMFVMLADGSVRNGYQIKISNKTHEDKNYSLSIIEPKEAVLKSQISDISSLNVGAGKVGEFKIFIILPADFLAQNEEGRGLVKFAISDENQQKQIEAVFISR